MVSRRYFVKEIFCAGMLAANADLLLSSCKSHKKKFKVWAYPNNSANAHRILAQDFPVPESTVEVEVLIVGSGIAGLSAARMLAKNDILNYQILELESQTGGNASFGENQISKYPWASHYLPIPNLSNTDLIDFLVEQQIIVDFDKQGLPIYDDTNLCFDQEERLFIYNRWHEGLVPQIGLTSEEIKQIEKFFSEIKAFNALKGTDGKYLFDIPMKDSSNDEKMEALDKISFKEYLVQNGYTSTHLLWYLNYCCRDDYGAGIEKVSAFAGIHYFASRRGKGANCDDNHILTWPEGNGRLKNRLEAFSEGKIKTNSVCYKIESDNASNHAFVYDCKLDKSVLYNAKYVVVATPLFVAKHMLKYLLSPALLEFINKISYFPWVTANITFNNLRNHVKKSLSWDNVVFDNACLGLVYAQHQSLKQFHPSKVFTYYRPFDESDAHTERHRLYAMDEAELIEIILKDCKDFYLEFDDISSIDYRVLGHGMICPTVDLLKNPKLAQLESEISKGIYLAHSDLSGYSIFEEAFSRGVSVAKQIIANEK